MGQADPTITDTIEQIKELASAPTVPWQDDSTATTIAALRDDFNLMLQKLRDAGVMQPPPDPEP